jgi:hypothetical protein
MPVKEHDIDAQKKSVKLDTGPYLKILQVCLKNDYTLSEIKILIF